MPALCYEVCQWLKSQLRMYQANMLQRFTLTLGTEETMAAIMSPLQIKAAQTVQDFIADRLLDNNMSWAVTIMVATDTLTMPVHLVFKFGKWSKFILPCDEVATEIFRRQPSDAKARIMAQMSVWEDAALPWAQAVDALDCLNYYASTPEQIAFYAPWVSTLVGRAAFVENNYPTVGERKDYARNRRTLALLHKPKRPKEFLLFAPEQREYLRAGSGAFAQLDMLGDMPRGPDAPAVAVNFAESRGTFISASPFSDDYETRTPLYC